MEEFYGSAKFIIAFMSMTIVIQMTMGNNITTMFLYLVLFSMIIKQSDKFIKFIEGVF